MPPLEDELRGALQGRAATLTPLADPFPGVERRARSLRRRRAAAAVAGTALTVLAVAGAVPLLTPDRTAAPAPGEMATSAPTPAPATDPFALDVQEPWAYRGPLPVEEQRASLTEAWTARHRDATAVVPLFGQVYEPSGRSEVVVLGRSDRGDRWGVLVSSEAGWEVVLDEVLPRPARALVAALPGDESARMLVVASPAVDEVRYSPDGDAPDLTSPRLSAVRPGVFTLSLEPTDPARDSITGLSGGQEAFAQPVPDPVGQEAAAPAAAPRNVLTWEPRGTIEGPVVLAARRAYAQSRGEGASETDVSEKVLFAGDDDAGRRYLIGQFWLDGDAEADTFGLVLRADGSVEESQLKQPVDKDAPVLAMHLPAVNAQSRAELLVVPQPGTGQVLYAGDQASEWAPKDTPGLDGVVLLARSPQAERGEAVDMLRLLDGHGRETATVRVPDLLCGGSSCS